MSLAGLDIDAGLPDAELVRLCRDRDEAAVRELTRRYNRRLFRVARSILRDDQEAEDVVQDTYVRAFTHLDSFRGDAGVGTWLVRIAMNEALGRKRKQRPTVDVDAVPMRARGADPETLMAQEQLRVALERAIDRLPEPFRIVFIARLVEGMTIEETALAFGLRPETVKTRVHRARVQLRRILEQDSRPALFEAFAFDGERCQRMTDAVVHRLREPLTPSAI
jgi:RNA polymerase sigma-70 factor (ECF subfamily)